METYFAPADRTSPPTLANHIECVSKSALMSTLLESVGGLLVVLNEDRQIIGLNEAFLKSLDITDPAGLLGLRLGESLHCIHAAELPHGCGTTPHCATCGAAIAMMAAIVDDKISEKTCALAAEKDGVPLERYLSVRAQPLKLERDRFILIFAQDITHQYFLTNLEQVFFHDINNILTALIGNSELLVRELPNQPRSRQILGAARRLCAEVSLQRLLSNRKDGANLPDMFPVSIQDIRAEVDLILCSHPNFHLRQLEQKWPNDNISILTDIHLVSRVLGNMLLNALEATAEGGTVSLDTTLDEKEITWRVHNEAYIPADVQLRIFQKHFSTKASMGRGMGTHSMKLLGEKFLNGKVTFRSTEEGGTTFCFSHPIKSDGV